MTSAASVLAPGLARKVSKILATRTESPDIIGALTTLSTFYENNTIQAQRRLRTTIEQHGLSINEQFLSAAEDIIKALDAVQQDLDNLAEDCTHINGALAGAKAASADITAETERVSRELAASQLRSRLAEQFLQQYQLSPEEVTALQGTQIGEPFFKALERVCSIHANCRSLLRTQHQRAGLELMDLMSSYQETAYEHLCRRVQGECRRLGDTDAPEVDPMLQRAASALRERPVLFKYCAAEVAGARHNALFQRFIGALTRGGAGGMPRPIEMHAHDPRRFISDMLAWVHQSSAPQAANSKKVGGSIRAGSERDDAINRVIGQALASERELLVALFGDDATNGAAGQVEDAVSPRSRPPDMPSTSALLDQVFESICRPLKVRIEGMLMAQPPLLLCFQISQLLAFYQRTVSDMLGSRCQLADTLAATTKLARRVFAEQLKARGDKLLRYPPEPPQDLSPPPQVAESLAQLKDITKAFEGSYNEAGSGRSSEAEFAPVLAAAVDPLVDMCERSADSLKPDAPSRVDESNNLSPSRRLIYIINCLAPMHEALAGRACAAGKAHELAHAMEAHTARLVGGECGQLLSKCGMAEVVERVRLYNSGSKLSEGAVMAADASLSLERVSGAMHAMFDMLSKPDILPEFNALQAPRQRADAVARIAQSLAEAYETVFCAIADFANGYTEQQGSSIALEHTPENVRMILGVLA